MKKIFFAGNPFGFGGPRQVNRNLLKHFDDRVAFLHHSNKILYFIEMMFKITVAKVVVFSGYSRYDKIPLLYAGLLGKKIIYIMHGCAELECKLNKEVNPIALEMSKRMIDKSNLILCVSQLHMKRMSEFYKNYADKMDFLTNGINWEECNKIVCSNSEKYKNTIVLIGGGRITKRNRQVCQAVEELNDEGNDLHVYVYGGIERNSNEVNLIKQYKCVEYRQSIPHSDFIKDLQKMHIFVQNSEFEPFSLGVVEALCCGCDILISQYVGAKEYIKGLDNNDIIFNPQDVDEIKNKLRHLLSNSNNMRLMNSIDKEQSSTAYAADKLINIGLKLLIAR